MPEDFEFLLGQVRAAPPTLKAVVREAAVPRDRAFRLSATNGDVYLFIHPAALGGIPRSKGGDGVAGLSAIPVLDRLPEGVELAAGLTTPSTSKGG